MSLPARKAFGKATLVPRRILMVRRIYATRIVAFEARMSCSENRSPPPIKSRAAFPGHAPTLKKTKRGNAMADRLATNKKKVLLTELFAPPGMALLKERSDIETITFPNAISQSRFQRAAQAARAGACGRARRHALRRGRIELVRRHAGGDPDRRRLRRGRHPRAEQAQGAADDDRHRQLAVGRRGRAVHDAGAGEARRRARFAREGEPLAAAARRDPERSARQDRCRRRLRPDRLAHGAPLPRDGNERFGLRSLQVGGGDFGCRRRAGRRPRRGAAARRLRQHPLPEVAANHQPVRRAPACADEADRVPDQHRARRHRRREGAARRADRRASSPAPASTCSSSSRRRTTIRCSS